MTTSYKTISSSVAVLHKDRGSKFYGHAYPVQGPDEVKNQLQMLKTRYPDASHFCYAYVLGVKSDEFRTNDDGEPNNTAGQPILREIKSLELTYVLVAVVRYFGGKKLGVSGLIDAYGTAANLALRDCLIIDQTVQKQCWIKHQGAKDYQVYEMSNRLGFTIVVPPSFAGGFFQIEIPLQDFESLVLALESLPNFELSDTPNQL